MLANVSERSNIGSSSLKNFIKTIKAEPKIFLFDICPHCQAFKNNECYQIVLNLSSYFADLNIIFNYSKKMFYEISRNSPDAVMPYFKMPKFSVTRGFPALFFQMTYEYKGKKHFDTRLWSGFIGNISKEAFLGVLRKIFTQKKIDEDYNSNYSHQRALERPDQKGDVLLTRARDEIEDRTRKLYLSAV